MSRKITFTLDLEDHRPDDSTPIRYPEIMDKVLDFWDANNIKATIFVVGSLAEKNPKIIRRIFEMGHEVAHHSYNHTILSNQTPKEFYKDTYRAKEIIEDITGQDVTGYRAPVFSLTSKTIWAIDILKELGFDYSSSILPARNPLHGIAQAPRAPFRWTNGLLEIPVPVGKIGSFSMPYLGGVYFRYLPFEIVKRQIKKSDDNTALWTYCHPYDFDEQEKNWRIKGASIAVSLLLWFNRKNMFKKLNKLADNFEFNVPFSHQTFDKNIQVISPTKLQ